MNKYLAIGLFALLVLASSLTIRAERIEKEKITISNDFVVVSNATFNGSVTIGGESRTNWPTGGGSAIQGDYPVFSIPIGLVNGNWTDFEIKATTNNFTSLVYYYKSWTNQSGNNTDSDPMVFFTQDYETDVRKWWRKTNDLAISKHLLSEDSVVHAIYFYPSTNLSSIPASQWMTATNANLIWSWVRVDDLGFEMNVAESKQLWSPIQPTAWVVERPTGLPWAEICTNKAASTASNDRYFGAIFVTNRIYLGLNTNAPWIEGLGTTNIQFGAGTNRAIFGSPW